MGALNDFRCSIKPSNQAGPPLCLGNGGPVLLGRLTTMFRFAKKGKPKIHKLEGTSLIKASELTELMERSAA